jgi:hypothetical protein
MPERYRRLVTRDLSETAGRADEERVTAPRPTDATGTGWRLRWYPRAILAALVLGFVVVVAAGSGSDAVSGRLGGDFPAFYAAGILVADDPAALYDAGRQAEAQTDLFADEEDGFLSFAYPPYVAAPYAVLAELPYRAAYVVHTLVMAALVVAALAVIRPLVPAVSRHFELGLVASLIFYPLLAAVTLGQNTALVLLLLAGAFRLLHDERDLAAGLVLAGLLFKPQYALPLVGCALLARRWRVAAGAALGAGALYLVGAAVQGWGWVGPWVDHVRWFTEVDAEVNADNAISWLGMAEALWGVGDRVALAVGWGLAAVTAAGLAWCWWSAPPRGGDARRLAWLMALSVPAMVLIAPHAMFYDAGVLVLALGVLASIGATAPAGERRATVAGLVVVWVAALAQSVGDVFPVAPLGPVTVAVLVWVVAAERSRPGHSESGRAGGGRGEGVPSTPVPVTRMAP